MVPDFYYSEANKSSGLTWDEARLDLDLVNPRAVVPGGTMPDAGIRNDTRLADLIAYLATIK